MRVFNGVKQYDLKRRMYVPVRIGATRSYGGRQQWFKSELNEWKELKSYYTHHNGCGVIAISDLFLYLAMTLPNGREETMAGTFVDRYGNINKEQYMVFVEWIRDRYARIYGGCGTFIWELCHGINQYSKENDLPIKAIFKPALSRVNLLQDIQSQLERNYPVILMVGQSWPVSLSKVRKQGIPFFKMERNFERRKEGVRHPFARYKIAEPKVYGHYVTVTGVIIDDEAEWSSQQIMLKISSWGDAYYISYDHYCRYMEEISRPWLCGMISLEDVEV